ncbi:MAG: fasciclin domain-containing protein [Syntrophales bacterium]
MASGSAVKAAELVETLSSKGPFTLFAPNESAFAKVQKASLDGMLKDLSVARKPYWTLWET